MANLVTFNCRSIRKNVHVVYNLCKKYDMIALQETFLPQQESHMLGSVHPSFHYIASSPVDLGNCLLRGRPRGGLAFLVHENIASKVKNVPTDDERILCLDVDFEGNPVRLINCYFPYYDGSNIDIYVNLLGKLNCLFHEHDNNHVIAMGDFNAHMTSEFGGELRDWCSEYGWSIADVAALPTDTHTWISDATGHARWLDHVVCPSAISRSLRYFKVHYEEIGSDHRPLKFTLDVSDFKLEPSVEYNDNDARFKVKDLTEYRLKSEISLKAVPLPTGLFLCRENDCTCDHHKALIGEFHNDILSALLGSSSKIDMSLIERSHNVPGWSDFVESYHQKARENYLAWCTVGKPRQGEAYQLMTFSRREFKKALDTCKQLESVIIRNKIANDMTSKKPWNTINKVRNKKLKLPLIVNGETGEDKIAETWKDHYSGIMSGEGHPSPGVIGNVSMVMEDISVVSVTDVERAMKDLSLNSSPGLDKITGDHLKYAHPTLFFLLSLLFTAMFRHTYIPERLSNIKICNLVKDNNKSLSDMSNYRPIAIASLVSKLFECIILQRSIHKLKTSDNQFAYKSKHSTDMALFLLKQTTEAYRTKNTPVFICTMDLSKAFDRVSHKRLFDILEKRALPKYITETLRFWYATQKFRVSWGNAESSSFKTGCGIRQGSVLSALLFAVYMDDLSAEILSKEGGCTVGDTRMNHIFYADDLILLSPSVKGLQVLIDKCHKYFISNFLSINTQKTKVLFVRPKRTIYFGEPKIYIGTDQLEVVNNFKYLGVNFNHDLSDDDHIASLYRGQCVRSNVLTRNFYMCDQSAKVHLFKSFCTSMYCIPLSLNCRQGSWNRLRVCYNNSLRYLMNIERYTSITQHFVNLRIPTFDELVRKNISSLFLRLKFSENCLIKAMFSSSFFNTSTTYKKWSNKIFCS